MSLENLCSCKASVRSVFADLVHLLFEAHLPSLPNYITFLNARKRWIPSINLSSRKDKKSSMERPSKLSISFLGKKETLCGHCYYFYLLRALQYENHDHLQNMTFSRD